MPHNPQSLQLTNQYRERLNLFRDRLQREAEAAWPTIEEFDGTGWTELLARSVERAQAEAIRATAGYLSAFLTLELGKPTKGPAILSRSKAGVGADGSPLAKSLESPRIGVLWRLKEGSDSEEALQYGLDRAKRQVGMDFDAAHRSALLEAIDTDSRFSGWQRATTGTCGACLGTAHGKQDGLKFEVHPSCQCVSEPVVEPFKAKKGQKAELAEAEELINGKWTKVEGAVKGKVEKQSDSSVMLNAGTPTKPRWIQGSKVNLREPVKAAAKKRVSDGLAHTERSFIDALSPTELKAVDSYKGYGYKNINGALRAGKPPGPTAEALDAALEKGSLGSDSTLYRAMNMPPGKGVGDSFTDLAYSSTSTKQVGARWAKGTTGDRSLLRIHAKAETKGAHIPGQNEFEFLLPRNSRFRILKESTKEGVRIFDVEII